MPSPAASPISAHSHFRPGLLLLSLLACAPFLACAESPAVAEPPSPRTILEKWIQESKTVRSVAAEFDQVRHLSSVARPLIKAGKLWLEKPDRLRWQVGDPPQILAVRDTDGRFIYADAAGKRARIWSREALLHDDEQGRGQGLTWLSQSFAGSVADFEKRFELQGVDPVPSQPELWTLRLTLRDHQAAMFVTGVTFTVSTKDGSLRNFTLQMRDGSRFETRIKSYQLNGPIDSALFHLDTTGYKIEDMGKGR